MHAARPPYAPAIRRRLGIPRAVLLLLAGPIAVGAAGRTADSRQPPAQAPAVIEESLAPGAKKVHTVAANAGDFIRVDVELWNLPLAASVKSASGRELARAEDPTGDSLLHLSAIGEEAGAYTIEAAALARDAGSGTYRLVVHPPRPATDADRRWVEADRIQMEAAGLTAQATADSRRRALERFRAAGDIWQRLGQTPYEAEALNEIGVLHYALGANADARAAMREALALYERVQDTRGITTALLNLGVFETDMGNPRGGLAYLERAGPLVAKTGLTRSEAVRLNNIGGIYQTLGDPRRALDYYARSLPLRKQVGDVAAQATALMNIGVARRMLGERDRALAAYEEALPLARAAQNRDLESSILLNMGSLFLINGETDAAIALYERSAEMARASGDRSAEAYTLGRLGRAHAVRKDYARAEDLLSREIEMRRAMRDRYREAHALVELSLVYRLQGRTAEALRTLEAGLDLQRAFGDRFGETATMLELGTLHLQIGRRTEARTALEHALASSRAIEDPKSEATILYKFAELQRLDGDLTTARHSVESAITLLETLRTRVSGAEARASSFVSAQEAYELELELLAALAAARPDEDLPGRALEMSERKRARSLLDSLADAQGEIVAGLDADLRRQETELLDRLRVLTQRQARLLSRPHTEEQAKALSRELQDVIARHQAAEEALQAGNPAYQTFLAGTTASASEVKQLLDDDTVLVEFALGERESFAWAVTRDRVHQVSLPARAPIAEWARATFEASSRPSRGAGDGRRATTAAAAFTAAVLGPLAAHLDRPRIAIVGDAILQRVPWASIPEPDGPHRGRPFVEAHEIVLLPSASILKALRARSRPTAPAAKSVAVLADPVFEADDPRLRRSTPTAKAPPREERTPGLLRAARELGYGATGFPRLPFSRAEAQAIAATAPAGSVLRALDFDASRDTALSPVLADFRIVHFATHGLMNDDHPARSGIVLSLLDRQGRPQDGFLRLPDLYNLRLNAELVVLSACRSALGKDLRGEGLLSVVRGFMYAGAPRVVATVWNVDDRATATLMAEFYRSMLIGGRAPAAALREAQLAVRARGQWRDPFYWAGFVLEGEWR